MQSPGSAPLMYGFDAWMTLDKLTDAIDSYDANHWQDDKPRVAAVGQSRSVRDESWGRGFNLDPHHPGGSLMLPSQA